MLKMLSRNAAIRRDCAHVLHADHGYSIGGRNKRNNETKSSDSSLDGATPVTLQDYTLRPWRFSTDVPRALLDTVIAGVGYLL